LKAVAGLEISAIAKTTKVGHQGVVANVLHENPEYFIKLMEITI